MYTYVYAYVYIHIHIYTYAYTSGGFIYKPVCTCVHMYLFTCMYMNLFISSFNTGVLKRDGDRSDRGGIDSAVILFFYFVFFYFFSI